MTKPICLCGCTQSEHLDHDGIDMGCGSCSCRKFRLKPSAEKPSLLARFGYMMLERFVRPHLPF